MTFDIVFGQIKKGIDGVDPSVINGKLAIQVTLTGLGGGTFYIEVLNGKLSVEPYDYHDRDAALTISVGDFKKLAEGKLDPVDAFNSGKLKIDGSIEKSLELVKLLETKKKK